MASRIHPLCHFSRAETHINETRWTHKAAENLFWNVCSIYRPLCFIAEGLRTKTQSLYCPVHATVFFERSILFVVASFWGEDDLSRIWQFWATCANPCSVMHAASQSIQYIQSAIMWEHVIHFLLSRKSIIFPLLCTNIETYYGGWKCRRENMNKKREQVWWWGKRVYQLVGTGQVCS